MAFITADRLSTAATGFLWMQEARFEIPKSFEKLEFYLGFSKFLRIFYDSKQNESKDS